MLRLRRKTEDEHFDSLIEKCLVELQTKDPGTDEYAKTSAHLERLIKLKAEYRPKRVNPDTVAIVVGNLVGILIIVMYEETHVITSKAFNTIAFKQHKN